MDMCYMKRNTVNIQYVNKECTDLVTSSSAPSVNPAVVKPPPFADSVPLSFPFAPLSLLTVNRFDIINIILLSIHFTSRRNVFCL